MELLSNMWGWVLNPSFSIPNLVGLAGLAFVAIVAGVVMGVKSQGAAFLAQDSDKPWLVLAKYSLPGLYFGFAVSVALGWALRYLASNSGPNLMGYDITLLSIPVFGGLISVAWYSVKNRAAASVTYATLLVGIFLSLVVAGLVVKVFNSDPGMVNFLNLYLKGEGAVVLSGHLEVILGVPFALFATFLGALFVAFFSTTVASLVIFGGLMWALIMLVSSVWSWKYLLGKASSPRGVMASIAMIGILGWPTFWFFQFALGAIENISIIWS